jgi:P-type E1-E2 ATPase
VPVAIVSLVTATNNYQKEQQFRALEGKEEHRCVVVRNGGEQIILAEDVMVGDIMVIKTGDAIIADAIFISGAGMWSIWSETGSRIALHGVCDGVCD